MLKKGDVWTKQRLNAIKEQVLRIKGGDERKARCKGENELLSMCDGKRLTQREAIYAQCFMCMGYYVDGKEDCGNKTCPLYYYMPYRAGQKEDMSKKAKDNTKGDI